MKKRTRSDYRKYSVSVALTKEENDEVTAGAKRLGISKAGYFRMKTLHNNKKEEQ